MQRTLWEMKIGGLDLVGYEAITDQQSPHPEVTIECDERFVILGGGARVDYGNGPGSLLTEMYPASPHTWQAKAKDHVDPSPASLSAYCVAGRLGPDDYYFAEKTDTGPHNAFATASLPREYTCVGGGARTYLSELPYAGSLLTRSDPSGEHNWLAAAKDHQVESPVVVTAYAIGLHSHTLESHSLAVLGNSFKDETYNPHPETSVDLQQQIDQGSGGHGVITCGGVLLLYRGPGNLLTGSWPEATWKWWGSGKDHNYPDPAQILVSAVALGERTS